MEGQYLTTVKPPVSSLKTKVQGVIINGKERLESDYVISNMHPQRTLEILDKNRSIKNAYISRIRSLENTYGIFTRFIW